MNVKDTLLAILIALVWGFNFVPMLWGMEALSPMMLGAARFFFVAFPLVLFVPFPKVKFRYLISYALLSTFLQFLCVFLCLKLGLSAGITSVVLQTQAIFTILFGLIFLDEKPTKITVIGMLVACLGLLAIAFASDSKSAPLIALLVCLLGAAAWGVGNIIIRKIISDGGRPDMMSMMVWGAVFLPLPFLVASWLFDTQAIRYEYLSWKTLLSAMFLAYFASVFGYTAWNNLLCRYSVGLVAPYSLLVPVFGIIFSYVFFKDIPSSLQWLGIAGVFAGLMIHVLVIVVDNCKANHLTGLLHCVWSARRVR